MSNNEYSYSTSTTRKRPQTVANATRYSVRKTLQRLHFCDIIYSEHRKECRRNDCYGRILNTRGDCKGTQEVRRHYHSMASTRQIARIQSRGYLAYKQKRLRELVSQSEQPYQTKRQAEINKATQHRWQTTIKKLTAVRFLSNAWKTEDKNHWCTLPVFSIATVRKNSQGLSRDNLGTHDRMMYL